MATNKKSLKGGNLYSNLLSQKMCTVCTVSPLRLSWWWWPGPSPRQSSPGPHSPNIKIIIKHRGGCVTNVVYHDDITSKAY